MGIWLFGAVFFFQLIHLFKNLLNSGKIKISFAKLLIISKAKSLSCMLM